MGPNYWTLPPTATMAFAKILAFVTPALVSAAPAQAATMNAATNNAGHSVRALSAEYVFEEHSGACRTDKPCFTGCQGTYDKKWKDQQSCENDCLSDRNCVGFEWTPPVMFAEAVCEIHFEPLVGGATVGFPGSNCFIKKEKPIYRTSEESNFCRGDDLDDYTRPMTRMQCEEDCDENPSCNGYSFDPTPPWGGGQRCRLFKFVSSFGDCVNLRGVRTCSVGLTCSLKL